MVTCQPTQNMSTPSHWASQALRHPDKSSGSTEVAKDALCLLPIGWRITTNGQRGVPLTPCCSPLGLTFARHYDPRKKFPVLLRPLPAPIGHCWAQSARLPVFVNSFMGRGPRHRSLTSITRERARSVATTQVRSCNRPHVALGA